jgi:SAM-dependent methyltransferase
VLELGCGHGVAVTLIAESLAAGGGTGTVLGVDRSAKMTAAAATRNAEHVAAGRAAFLTSSIHDADLGDAGFDKVLAVHVPVFLRGDPGRELAHLREHLADDGTVHVVAQPFTAGQAEPARDAITAAVERHGWTIRAVHVAPMAGTAGVCVVAGYG